MMREMDGPTEMNGIYTMATGVTAADWRRQPLLTLVVKVYFF